MISLYQFPSYFGLPSGSPFCIKLETYLKLAQIPYQIKITYDPRPAPKQKLPIIKDGDKTIADSSLIIDYLKKTYGDKLDQHLTEEQKAIGTGIQRLCEEHLYWLMIYERWLIDAAWELIKPAFFGKMPFPLRLFVPNLIRTKMRKACYQQGIGRFNEDERVLLGKQNIDAIATLLGSQKYFFGDTPTSIDATIWGFLTAILNTPIPSKLKDHASSIRALVDYDGRMKKLFGG